MAAATPYVQNRLLTYSEATYDYSIPLESQTWWDWLSAEETTTFRFSGSQGQFTARRENKQGNHYWYAYRRHESKLTKMYLGKSEELTEQRLCNIAQTITERIYSEQKMRKENISTKDPFLSLKFVPPPMRSSLVSRPRLITHLSITHQQAFTLISAPAGSGKSSLLRTWYFALSEANVPVVWISLDQRDNDSSRFWSTFISAIQILFPSVKNSTLASFRASRSSHPETMLSSLLSNISSISEHFTLLFDDYHLIDSPAIHRALLYLLDHLPPHMHIVMATRTDPSFPLARLRAQGLLAEIRTEELSFTIEEATLFFHQTMQIDLSVDEIRDLISHTEGWIAGLQLAALSLQGLHKRGRFIHTFTGDHDYIVEYLAEEVLNRQPEHIQNFLLSTSLLDRFTSSLCNNISGQEGGQTVLRDLERMNLFLIPLDEQRHWYRYHTLFSDFLRHRLVQLHPERISELHLKAASWYEQHAYFEDAVQHFLAAPNFAEAARIMEQSCETLLKRGEVTTLLHWLESLPEEQIRARPYLSINYAGVLGNIEKLDLAEIRLQDAERAIREMESQSFVTTNPLQSERDLEIQELRGALAVARASLAGFRGDVAQTIELSRRAYAQLAEDDTYFRSVLSASLGVAYARSGNLAEAAQIFLDVASTSEVAHHTYLSLISVCVQALLLMEKGQLRQAANLYRQILQQSAQEGEQQHIAASMAYLGLGELYYYWNDLDAAESSLLRGLHFEQSWEFMMSLVRGILFLAKIKNARGKTEEAFAVLHDIERQALMLHLPSIVTHIEATRVTLWLAQGTIEEAVLWAQCSGLSVNDEINYLNEFPYLTLAQVFSAMGDFEPATTLLSHILERAEVEGRTRSILESLLTQALIEQQQNKIDQASHTLARALSLTETEGNIRVFVEKGIPMRNLLSVSSVVWAKGASVSPFSSHYVDTLLTAFNQQYGVPDSSIEYGASIKDCMPVLSLTEREQDILHLLALGLSNQQMARKLVISTSTVKWYLKQIYTKLDTHNRMQTVARARELHFL